MMLHPTKSSIKRRGCQPYFVYKDRRICLQKDQLHQLLKQLHQDQHPHLQGQQVHHRDQQHRRQGREHRYQGQQHHHQDQQLLLVVQLRQI